jgi:membrane fusion protein (multidrug efflux system)
LNKHLFKILKISFLLLLTSCSSQEKAKTEAQAVDVKTESIVPTTIPAIFSFVGFTQSSHEVEIRARVEGYLEKVVYKEGSFVNEGEILYYLDHKPFEAAVENARGALSKQQAILWNAKKTRERLDPLFKEKAASRKDLDTAISEELSATAEVQSAKAKLMQAELDLGYTTIKSPISGLASDTHYKEGALITPGQNALLTTVSVVDPIFVYFSISENERLKFRKQEMNNQIIVPKDELEIELILADNTIYPYKGKVNFSSPTIDQKTGTMSIRATLPNPGSVLMPGQFVRINVIGAERPNAIVVPQRAVLEGKNGMFVYVVINNKTEIREVEVGDWYQKNWIIQSGLVEGDVVIIDGVNKVRPGSPVHIIESEGLKK